MILGRKGTLVTLVIVLIFSMALINCATTPDEPTTTEPMTEEPAVEEPKVETFEPPPMAEPVAEPVEEPKMEEPMAFDVSDLVDVFFAFDKSDLTPESRDRLAQNAKLLKAAANVKILIEGHCDERGTNEYNLGLGERRANSTKDYLVSLGVSASRIKTISYGEEKPFAMGHNEEAWKQNRRAHFALQ